jgi:hypothetical protein
MVDKPETHEDASLETKDVILPKDGSFGFDEQVVKNGDKTLFRFKRLGEYKPGESWILLYYGPSKAGKTYFAGTAGARTLFINIGDGLETLLSPAFTSRYPEAKDMIVVDIRELNPEGFAEAFDLVGDAIHYALKNFPDKFDVVVLDEATAFRKYAMNKSMELNTEARKKGTARDKRTEDFVKPDIGDYGTEMQMIEWFLGTYIPILKEHKKHFIMLAHERQTFSKAPKIGDDPVLKRVLPGFTGKTFPDQIPQYFDDVFHAEVVGGGTNVAYRVRTAGSEAEIGGARHGGIFSTVETDPNYLKMLDRIKRAQALPRR